MHIYIYDAFVNQKKYDRLLAKIETRVTDLGLNGKIARMGLMTNIKTFVENELRRSAKTIVVVGNNKTLNQALTAMVGGHVPLGIIPIDEENNSIARAMGIPTGENACDILSARRIETIDLGSANNHCFMAGATIINDGTIIEIEKNFTLEALDKGEVNIINLKTERFPEIKEADPTDGKLKLIVQTKKTKKLLKPREENQEKSEFLIKQMGVVNNKNHPLIIDESFQINTPVEIRTIPKCLKIIVGKNRTF